MLEGLLSLDRDSAVPLPEQIYRGARRAILDGRLALGGRLPSSRSLAAGLQVSRNTVNAAYELLLAEGMIEVKPGAAPRVVAGGEGDGEAPGELLPRSGEHVPGLSGRGLAMATNPWGETGRRRGGRLEPGTPALDCFPQDAWARALRRAARRLKGPELFYDRIPGYEPLREVLAAYLIEERGLRASAERIIVLPSTQSALFLIASALADPGDCVWLEDPGYLGARAAFQAAGLDIRCMPVDEEGADPRMMPEAPPPRLVYVTPSHQYPFGMRMPLNRRLLMLERVRACGGLVVEDDYDSEFLFEGRPLAAMQGLGGDGDTIYLGTFSKSMLPGLRVAYMVVPQVLAEPLARVQRVAGAFANVATQAALADFMEGGHYRAHLRRIREIYARRGQELAGALRARLGNRIVVEDPVGGIQIALRFNLPCDDQAVARKVNERGFGVAALSAYGLSARVSGLVIGFAALREGDAETCAREIAQALDTAMGNAPTGKVPLDREAPRA